MTLTEFFRAQLEREAAISRRVLARVPEGRPDWKPHDKSMPLGYLATLVATMPSWIAMAVNQDELDLQPAGGAKYTPPEWATAGEHTCDLVDFDGFSGARVLIVGGRQSAYEWAALLSEHGAEHIDVVHRHPKPRFAKVSWSFVDQLIDQTLAQRGWYRTLPQGERDAIARRFWEVGRLTLEHWLEPRLKRVAIHADTPHIDAGAYNADRIVFATGYKADLERVPYLRPLQLATRNGFPVLDEAMQSSQPGLYLPGFTATQDFGPFFGFVKGAPAAASLVARDLT